jgi:hypothetical protein
VLRAPNVILPRTLIQGEVISAPFETDASKGRLVVEVSARTGGLEYAPVLQAFEPFDEQWFDLPSFASFDYVSQDFVFYDMTILFPPSNFVRAYLGKRHRVRFSTNGTGTMTLLAWWQDVISTRQSA